MNKDKWPGQAGQPWVVVLAALEDLTERDGLRVVVCWAAWRIARRWRRRWLALAAVGTALWMVMRLIGSGVVLGH